jgi:hypothetical protein
VVEIADDSHLRASGSTPETQEVQVAGMAILLDRLGQAKDDAVAAFMVTLPVRGAPETRADSDGPSAISTVEAALLCRGLVPIATLDPGCLREMPTLDGWLAINDRGRRHLTILEPTGCLFDGFLGRSVPEEWYDTVARQHALALLTTVKSDSPVDPTGLADLCEPGRLMGGIIKVRSTSPPTRPPQLRPDRHKKAASHHR